MMNPLTQEAVSKAITFLDKEKRKVLELKYGIGGKPKYSDTKTGKLINKSSRQVDAIEKTAVRNLRRQDIAKPLFKALTLEDDFIWKTISNAVSRSGRTVLKTESYESLFDPLPGEIILLLRCVYNRVASWLPDNAMEAPAAWFRSKDDNEVLRKIKGLSEIIEKTKPPVFVGYFMENLDLDLDYLEFILALHDGNFKIYGEFIAEQPLSSDMLRSIRIHMMFSYKFKTETLPLNCIIEEYNSIYEDDHLVTETAMSSLVDRPHIFKDSRDENWSANENSLKSKMVMRGNTNDISHELSQEKADYFFERPWTEVTAADIIKDLLLEIKIGHCIDIIRLFVERTNRRYVEVNVSPVLHTSKEFLRLAPSVFGWASSFRNMDPVSAESNALLNRRDCRNYVLGRYAGESMSTYPLWTPAMERKWCLWAMNCSFPKLYQSLVYIANPDLWPVSDAEKEEWKEKKQWDGFYHFESPITLQDWEKLPSLQDLFVIANQVKAHGCINWMRINRFLNQRRHFQRATPILMGLISLNVILPAGHWQQMHTISPEINEFLPRLVDEIKGKGFLHWDDEAGLYFRNYIRNQQIDKDLGWVSKEDHKILADLSKPGLIRRNISDYKAIKTDKSEHLQKNTGEIPKVKAPEQLNLF